MSQKRNREKIIYLAEDDEDDRLLFFDGVQDLELQAAGKAACDGQELLNMLDKTAERLPDMIFLDINMPIKNGFDCLEKIRSREGALKEVRIIMLSTSKSPDNIELCYKLGADFYAVKPSSFQGLKDLLQKVFEMEWGSFQKSASKFLLA
ncbi:response regulator [Flavobacterium sp. KACC 22763]|uniref:response regulator n=1 Tax=Flavobacterium sp. KACC 22763 TaxID=3025668 RepID=UPI0023669F38|nr:response regulator [Flavobacterium sp. KACC 22763]WDF66132.1 response regulator [Flavobacterium sp. KACC 22763]